MAALTRLCAAVERDDLEGMPAALERVVQAGGTINSRHPDTGRSALYEASSAAMVRWLLDRGADMHTWGEERAWGATNALEDAIIRGRDDAALAMVSWPKADVNGRGLHPSWKFTPLMTAVCNRCERVVRYLVAHPDTDFEARNVFGRNIFEQWQISVPITIGTTDEMTALMAQVRAAALVRRRWTPLRAAWFNAAAVVK